MSTLHDINMEKTAPCFQLRTGGSGHRFHNGKKTSRAGGIEPATSGMQFDALASRAIYDTEGGRRVNNITLFSSVSPLVLVYVYRSVFSRPVCPYAIVTFDPVTRDVTILPGAARPAHSLGEGDDRGGEGQPRTQLMVGCTFSAFASKNGQNGTHRSAGPLLRRALPDL